jgi:hypothetical protein
MYWLSEQKGQHYSRVLTNQKGGCYHCLYQVQVQWWCRGAECSLWFVSRTSGTFVILMRFKTVWVQLQLRRNLSNNGYEIPEIIAKLCALEGRQDQF